MTRHMHERHHVRLVQMSGTHLSHQSLQWTRPLLDELCEEVRQAVERFGDEERERQAGDLDSAIEACDKVAGSLAVMEFSSGQLIAEAMGLASAGSARRQGRRRSQRDCQGAGSHRNPA
jgi:hypothetical protein